MEDGITWLRKALQNRLPLDADIHDRRRAFAKMAAQFPALPDVAIQLSKNLGEGRWFIPHSRKGQAVILYLHGGGYALGSWQEYAGLVSRLANATSCPIFAFDYPLAPEAPYPAAQDACVSVLQQMIEEYGAENIAIIGDSAGANLGLMAIQRLPVPQRQQLMGFVGISGYFDLTNSASSIVTHAHRDPFLDAEKFSAIRDMYLAGCLDEAQSASALFGTWEAMPPLLLMVGSEEILLDDSRRVADFALVAGAKVTFEVWPEMIHVWPYFAPKLLEATRAITRIGDFIDTLHSR